MIVPTQISTPKQAETARTRLHIANSQIVDMRRERDRVLADLAAAALADAGRNPQTVDALERRRVELGIELSRLETEAYGLGLALFDWVETERAQRAAAALDTLHDLADRAGTVARRYAEQAVALVDTGAELFALDAEWKRAARDASRAGVGNHGIERPRLPLAIDYADPRIRKHGRLRLREWLTGERVRYPADPRPANPHAQTYDRPPIDRRSLFRVVVDNVGRPLRLVDHDGRPFRAPGRTDRMTG